MTAEISRETGGTLIPAGETVDSQETQDDRIRASWQADITRGDRRYAERKLRQNGSLNKSPQRVLAVSRSHFARSSCMDMC